MEESQIIEIWDVFKEYISDKNKEVAANQYVDFLLGKDVELSVLEGLVGYDGHLDDAIKLVLDDEVDEDSGDDWENNESEEDW